MLEVIQCTCCGRPVGDRIDLYDFLVDKIKRDWARVNAPESTPDRIQLDPRWNVELDELFEILDLRLECCRVSMLSKLKVSRAS